MSIKAPWGPIVIAAMAASLLLVDPQWTLAAQAASETEQGTAPETQQEVAPESQQAAAAETEQEAVPEP